MGRERAVRKVPTYVAGIVDGYGAVQSKGTETCQGHKTLYPGMHQFRWRWCAEWGLRESDHSTIDDIEMRDAIERHMKARYGIDAGWSRR